MLKLPVTDRWATGGHARQITAAEQGCKRPSWVTDEGNTPLSNPARLSNPHASCRSHITCGCACIAQSDAQSDVVRYACGILMLHHRKLIRLCDEVMPRPRLRTDTCVRSESAWYSPVVAITTTIKPRKNNMLSRSFVSNSALSGNSDAVSRQRGSDRIVCASVDPT